MKTASRIFSFQDEKQVGAFVDKLFNYSKMWDSCKLWLHCLSLLSSRMMQKALQLAFYFFLLFYVLFFWWTGKSYLCIFLLRAFFYKRHFYKQRQTEIAKRNNNKKQHTEAELLIFENYSYFSSTLQCKNNRTHYKEISKKRLCLCSWVYTINHNENEDQYENILHRYHINRPRHRHKCSKYKKFLSMMMFIYVLSNT